MTTFLLSYASASPATSPTSSDAKNKLVSLKMRWVKGNLSEYYRLSGEALAALKLGLSCSSYDVDCISHNHSQSINDYYSNIVSALMGAKKVSIPSIPHSAFHNFWRDEFDELKNKSVSCMMYGLMQGRVALG